VYSLVYPSLSKTSAANSNIRLMFTNGHFCYALKSAIITNTIGLPLAILQLFDINPTNSDPIEDKAVPDLKASYALP